MEKNKKHRKFLIIGALIAAPSLVFFTFNLSLAVDCSKAWCGDGICQPECGETHSNCPFDCPDPCKDAWCGDGICQPECGETASNCPQDCYVDPCKDAWCGDGICQPECGETPENCPYDCGEPCTCTSWSSWQNVGCGKGNCSANQMLQKRTRTCTPAGCKTEEETRCISHNDCITCTCTSWSSWQNVGCGKGDCSSIQMLQKRTRTCTPAGCDTEEQTQCISWACCLPTPTVDLKANNSDGPITVSYKSNVVLSWTSENASSCQASGDWSGTKATSGSQTIQVNQVKTHNFTLTCKDSSGIKTGTDSVTVNVTPNPPTVITLPAVITY